MPTREKPVAPRASLLGLPFELREQIYHEYFTVDGGYVYDGDSCKLVQASNQPIELSLRYACRAIAHETGQHPFTLNAITFSTLHRQDWRKQTHWADYIMVHHTSFQDAMLTQLKRRITPECTRTLISSILKKDPLEFSQAIGEILPGWADSHSVLEFFNLTFDPWAIPSVDEVKDKLEELQLSSLWETPDSWHQLEEKLPGYTGPEYRYQQKIRLSAAAVTIKFLGQISRQQRLYVSKLVLNEDRNAISSPECHVLGLISFFRENSKLIVEHRLNLWRNILPTSVRQGCFEIALDNQGLDLQEWDNIPQTHQARSCEIARAVTNIIMHISKALTKGLPSRSYSLTIEGDPDLNHSTEFFSTIMKPFIAWLTANTACVAQGILLPPEHCNYPFDTRSSGKEMSVLRSNFTLDQPWNYKEILQDNKDDIIGMSLELLMTGFEFEPRIVDVSNDIIDWMEIKRENFLREEIKKDADGETAA
ncbi:uncharacterized protein FFB14_08283 [Fusarium fujikuroi]|nr:uncharacterized protein FFB14_08283 [Fusarium fujikuroi]